MKQFIPTLFMLLACMYLHAQPGTPDVNFNAGGTPGYVVTDIDGQNDIVKAMAVKTSDKSIYVTGYIAGSGDQVLFIAHYLSDGSLDPTFGPGGFVKYSYSGDATVGNAIGLQSDGTVVVGGWSYPNNNRDFFVGRFNGTTGAVISETISNFSDITTANGVDEINALVVLPDDKIVVTGFTRMAATGKDITIAQYTAAGALVTSGFNGTTGYILNDFFTGGDDIGNAVAIDKTNGDIIVAGTANDQITNSDFAIVRVSSAGLPVTSFTQDIGTATPDKGTAVAIDRTGNMVVAGTTNNVQDIALVRYTPAGVLDLTNFGGGTGMVITGISSGSGENVSSVIVQDDDKIVVGGTTESATNDYDPLLVRYTNAGALDASFGNATPSPNGTTVMLMPGTSENPGAAWLSGDKIYFAGYNTDIVLAVFNNNNYALPLVLSSFYAQKQTSKVVLQWQTTSEEGVKQFVIQRSTDGKTFQSIGTVAATGNSSLTKHYSFADQSPFMAASNYYRLLMQDADGNYKYSKMLIIKFDGQLTTSLSVFPNPTRDLLQVQLPDGMNGTVALQIIDLNGRVIKRNNLASDGHALNTSMDVSTLTKGIYILKAQAGNITVTSRFIKK